MQELKAKLELVLQGEEVYFTYDDLSEKAGESQPESLNTTWALQAVNCAIERGTYTAIVGPNGSGKSTLARHFNALLLPQFGRVTSFGIDSKSDTDLFELRRLVGMVFQNPDNQIIGTTVEEDMAFGPENLAIPPAEIVERIKAALKLLKMEALAKQAPSNLSGGQKQKLAVGSILVMQPKALILDEATSMLDPDMRRELLAFIRKLRLEQGLTVVNVTHHLDELLTADKVMVLVKGNLQRVYRPIDLFNDDEMLDKLALRLPGNVLLLKCLLGVEGEAKLNLPDFEETTMVQALTEAASKLKLANVPKLEAMAFNLDKKSNTLLANLQAKLVNLQTVASNEATEENVNRPLMEVKHLSYRYPNADNKTGDVLHDISFDVKAGEILAIVGHSGSGKSTLIMHLNALLKNEPGQVLVHGLDAADKANFLKIRRHVALLFQYPEHQLFAETVYKDIAYGPTKLGYSQAKVKELVKLATDMLGFDESVWEKSPFELSGGQMRRVALAGIVAMWPDVFVLDEPAAGLDDKGRNEIFNYIRLLKKLGKTIIVVSHNMEDVAEFADRVLIMKQGKLVTLTTPDEIFTKKEFLQANSLEQPALTAALQQLKLNLSWPIQTYAPTLANALRNIANSIKALNSAPNELTPNLEELKADSVESEVEVCK